MKEGRGRIILQWFLLLLGISALISLLFFKFYVDVMEESTKQVETETEEVTEKYALKVTNDFQSITTSGKTIAQILSGEKDPAAIQLLLAALVDQTQIYEAVYCDEKGKVITQDGKTGDLNELNYQRALEPVSEVTYRYRQEDGGLSGEEAIVVIVPVSEAGDRLILLYSMERIKTLTEITGEFDKEAFAVVSDKDGNLFSYQEIESNFTKKGNIWKNIDKKYVNAGTQARVAMQNARTYSTALASEGEERTIIFTPIGVEGWNLVIGINQDYVDAKQNQAWTKTLVKLCWLLFLMVLFFIVFMISNAITRKRNAERSKTLQEKADTDLLTGLNNKLATERKIKEYIENFPNSMAMMFVLDIDNFKTINDTLGHAFGDEVLRTLGKHIGVNFRVTDIIGRSGGDEFTIFLKDLKEDANTLKEAQKLVKFFKDFQVGEYVKYSPTASIGAAVFPADGKDFDALYKAADQALYKAKKRGKNQLAFFDDRDRVQS